MIISWQGRGGVGWGGGTKMFGFSAEQSCPPLPYSESGIETRFVELVLEVVRLCILMKEGGTTTTLFVFQYCVQIMVALPHVEMEIMNSKHNGCGFLFSSKAENAQAAEAAQALKASGAKRVKGEIGHQVFLLWNTKAGNQSFKCALWP